MPLLLVLVIVLPPLLLLLGLGLGAAGASWWWLRRSRSHKPSSLDDAVASAAAEAAAMEAGMEAAEPSATTAGLLRSKDVKRALLPPRIHIVASCASMQPPSSSAPYSQACLPVVLPLAEPSSPCLVGPPAAGARQHLHAAPKAPDCPGALTTAMQLVQPAGSSGGASPGGGEPAGMLQPTRVGHRKTASMDLGQLVRAGPSVISQVMDDWDARSTLYRIMSLDAFNLPSPQQQQARGSLLSPAAAALFSPVAGGAGAGGPPPLVGMPSGEVHMDEIDLMECIGKGGYGCVYKGSWRGAGVAVKYIVCPTDDSDSLGRAIREVVLSKKMSHPNVVQCYAWTVLTEPEPHSRSATPGSISGLSSPLNQSFTSRRQGRVTGRASLELLRPMSAGDAPGGAGARRGLDLRFTAVAGGDRAGGTPRACSSPTLQRITERPTQEGRTLQAEVEGALSSAELAAFGAAVAREAGAATAGAASMPLQAAEEPAADEPVCRLVLLRPQPAAPLVEELVAEAAAEHMLQAVGCGGASRQQSPDPPAAASFASSKQLKLALPLPPSSRSPSSSPGIRAVHAPGPHPAGSSSSGTPDGAAQAAAGGPSPDQCGADARSVEPASLPQSPFASVPAQAAPPRHSMSTADLPRLSLALPSPLAVRTGSRTVDAAAAAAAPEPQSSEEEGGGAYAQFGSYEEMVQHFRQLAAEGQAHQGEEPVLGHEPQQCGQQSVGEEGAWAAGAPAEVRRLGSLRTDGDAFMVTAASSFSDVLSVSGFMLEGTASGPELTALSLPSSPRYGNASANLHSRQSSLLQPSTVPSAASSRPITPHAGTVGSLSRLAWSASAAPLAGSTGGLPSREQLVACMPPPAWLAPASAAPTAAGGGTEPQLAGVNGDSVRLLVGEPAAPQGAGGHGADATPNGSAHAWEEQHCEQGQQLEGGEVARAEQLQEQPPAPSGSQGVPAVEESLQIRDAVRHSSIVSLSLWQAPGCASDTPGSKAVFTAWQSPASPFRQPTEGGSPPAEAATRVQLDVGSGASGSVTPRLASLASLGPAANSLPLPEGSPQVTPRQQSLPGCSPRVCSPRFQASPRAESLRGTGARSSGRRRVEELREQAAAALGGGGGDGPASVDRTSLSSHQDSFNSEEGFGSPVKQRCGGVKDVFQLEELQLSGQDALMVVVMEYCDLGSLRKALKRKAFRPSAKWPFQTTYRALLRTAQEVAKGMGYIHEFNIVHGDLKPGNVLLKTHKVDRRGYIAKVSDFGLSRPLDMEDTHASLDGTLGTIAYSAPETFAHNQVKKPSDVYAFGIMLWEMFYCRDPYEGLLEGQICVGVTDGSLRPEFDEECPEPYRRLAERCWHQDPELRPSFEEVDRELVRIEMEFRLHRHRAASKRGSSASAGASRPGSPEVAPRGGSARQFQASALAG